MKARTKKLWRRISLIGAGVGGLVHLLQPLGVNLLGIFGGISTWVQAIAGVLTLYAVFMAWK